MLSSVFSNNADSSSPSFGCPECRCAGLACILCDTDCESDFTADSLRHLRPAPLCTPGVQSGAGLRCLKESAVKSDSQSVSQRIQANPAQRHSGQPNDGELLSALLEKTEDSIYFKDLDSRFLRISHALAKKLHLHRADDAVGKSDSDFFAQT